MKTEWTFPEGKLLLGDCLTHMKQMKKRGEKVDLICGSPPYEDQRLYLEDGEDLGIARDTEEWVSWMVEVVKASLDICDGLVAYVIGHGKGGKTWSGAPALLMADLIRQGINLRSPCWYKRQGIMGGGGKDWLRSDVEFILCATNGRIVLPYSDNVACGKPPVYGPGGEVSHRNKDGKRVNDPWNKRGRGSGLGDRNSDGSVRKGSIQELAEKEGISKKEVALRLNLGERPTNINSRGFIKKSGIEGDTFVSSGVYVPPDIANPGNIIDCGTVGGGHMGSNISHESEAPFPDKIPNFFIRSFCKPGGTVLDPFMGSATTLAEAIKTNRKFIGIDLRPSQIKLALRRIKQARLQRGFGIGHKGGN